MKAREFVICGRAHCCDTLSDGDTTIAVGQPAEFEENLEIERKFRGELAVTRQPIDDVLPKGEKLF